MNSLKSNMQEKGILQQEFLDIWKEADCKGTLVAATGSGKTKIGVDAISYLSQLNIARKVLIVVPTTNLKDNEWPNELKNWGNIKDTTEIEIVCIQTAYKFKYTKYDLIVVDEIHTTLSEKYSNIYELGYKYILGLTATIPEDEYKINLLQQYAPVLKSLSVNQAVKRGIVADYQIYNVKVPLTQKERKMYNSADSMFKRSAAELSNMRPNDPAFETASELIKSKDHIMFKEAQRYWMFMSKRRNLCYNAEHKITAAFNIIKRTPDKKWITFSVNIKSAEVLYEKLKADGIKCVIYHSKMNDQERKEALKIARRDDCRVIISAQALNAGYDLPAIDGGICISGFSTSLVNTQQLGRTLRKNGDKVSIFINLVAEDTQEEKWVKSKTSSLKFKWLDKVSELYNYITNE